MTRQEAVTASYMELVSFMNNLNKKYPLSNMEKQGILDMLCFQLRITDWEKAMNRKLMTKVEVDEK